MADQSTAIPGVSPTEAAALIEGGAYLLDVREPDEWAAGRAPSASHIPLGQLADRFGEVPADTKIVCVCRGGGRSGQATEALVGLGYDAVNLEGGMRAWAGADLPVIADDGGAGTVI